MQELNSNNSSSIDHLVVAASTLEEGVQYVEQLLGVKMQPGGKHVRMGTHNYLLKLGNKMYLEVIAIDSDAAVPDYPRWFGLSNADTLKSPRLITWIVRTNNINTAAKALSIDHITIQKMNRGNYEWLLTIPDDGNMPCDGIAPMLIEWKNNLHPCDKLEDKGCRLLKLEAFHPNAKVVTAIIAAVGFEGPVVINEIADKENAHLAAYIQTTNGICVLR